MNALEAEERRRALRAFLERYDLQGASLDRLDQALTHRSYAFENEGAPDNERLEFLGDAVVGCVASALLYEKHPEDREGRLSKKKGFLVSRTELGRRAAEMGIDDLVLLGRGEEAGGGRKRAALTGSALEAVVAALFLDLPFERLAEFVRRTILAPALPALEEDAHLDYKSRLQELVQRREETLPVYRKLSEKGLPHERRFVVEAVVLGEVLGRGEGSRIKSAENKAAREAYEILVERYGDVDEAP